MATILIAEDDDLLARQMANTLRQAGHVPILARDVRGALEAAHARPDGILLDLDLPDVSLTTVLAEIERGSATARIPLLVVTGKRETIAHLEETGRVAAVLRKPVSGIHLRESVDTLLESQSQCDPPPSRLDLPRQRQLILHLIAHGSNFLALQISRRLCVDRVHGTERPAEQTLTWSEIAAQAHGEGLLDAEQARLLGRISEATSTERRQAML